jgi:hypothetical protein
MESISKKVHTNGSIRILGIARGSTPIKYAYQYIDGEPTVYIERGEEIASHHPQELLSYFLSNAKYKY